tara:strand:- start:150 stop:419 length:270 start_codon:yes stop_codon:yes gene_type:complete
MAFNKWKKSATRTPPKRTWTLEEMKIIGWCLNKNIGVGIMPDWKNDLSKWRIDIEINSKTHTDPSTYDDDDVYKKVNEYYKYYYEKYNV